MGRGSVARGLLALSIGLAIAGAVVAIGRSPQPLRPRDPVVAYLDALARHDYQTAYALSDLSAARGPASSSGLTRAHFEAFERAHPLKSWRRVGNSAELTYQDGARARTSFAVDGDRVHVPVSAMLITTNKGPLPGLSVDGVSIPIKPLPLPGTTSVGAFHYRYGIVVIQGTHRFDVAAGPATAATTFTRAVRTSGEKTLQLSIALRQSARGNAAAVRALRNIMGTCPDDLCLVEPCGPEKTQYVLEAGYDLIVGRNLVGSLMPRDGWAIAITFVDQAQPAVLKNGPERTTTLRARYIFGFVPGRAPKLLDRCWTSR